MSAFNTEAFGDEKPKLTNVNLKSYFSLGDKVYSYKNSDESKHPSFLDMNVIYNKRDAVRAAAIREREEEMKKERER